MHIAVKAGQFYLLKKVTFSCVLAPCIRRPGFLKDQIYIRIVAIFNMFIRVITLEDLVDSELMLNYEFCCYLY